MNNDPNPIKLFQHQEDYLAELQDMVQTGVDLGTGQSESKMVAGYIGPDGEVIVDLEDEDSVGDVSQAGYTGPTGWVNCNLTGSAGLTGVVATPKQSAAPSGDAGEFVSTRQSRGGRPRKPKGQRFSDVLNARILKERQIKLAEKASKNGNRNRPAQ